jgi:hypothetical protein
VHVPIHATWKTISQPLSWSFGHCKHCDQNGTVRLESTQNTLYLNDLIPISKQFGTIAVCDFCERPIEFGSNRVRIKFADWSPRDGVPALLTKLGMPPSSWFKGPTTDTQLHSLLTSAEETARRTHPSKFGSFFGMLGGIALGVLLAWLLFKCRIFGPPPQMGAWMFIMGFAGAFIGSISGGVIEYRIVRDRVARAKIAAAHAKCQIDLFRLNELAAMHGRRIQRAVQNVSSEAMSEIA